MLDFVASAVKRTRREVGYPLPASPGDLAALVRVYGDVYGDAGLLPVPTDTTAPSNIFGEVLDAAARFSDVAFRRFGGGLLCDAVRIRIAAQIVHDGFPVDTALDTQYLLRMRGRERDVLDDPAFVGLLRHPAAVMRLMHPDYAPRLLANAVDAIAERAFVATGSSPNARGARPPYLHAMSPPARRIVNFFWR